MSRPTSKIKGIRQACDACHSKKVRCPKPPESPMGPCDKCRRDRIECVFSPMPKMGRPKKLAMRVRQTAQTEGFQDLAQIARPSSPTISFLGGFCPSFTASSFHDSFLTGENGIDFSAPDFPFDDNEQPLEQALPHLGSTHEAETLVLAKLESLASLQQQLMGKRRALSILFDKRKAPPHISISGSIGEILDITQKVINTHIWLMLGAAHFSWRTPKLHAISDETSTMLIVSPAMVVLDLFVDIVAVLRRESSKGESTTTNQARPSSQESGVVDPPFLQHLDPIVLQKSNDGALPSNLATHTGGGFGTRDPIREYVLFGMLEYHVERMQQAVDVVLSSLPQMDSKKGGQGLMSAIMDEYVLKMRAVNNELSRAGHESSLSKID